MCAACRCCGIVTGSDVWCSCLWLLCLKFCWLRRLRWFALTFIFAFVFAPGEKSATFGRGAGKSSFKGPCLPDAAPFGRAMLAIGVDIQDVFVANWKELWNILG